MTSGAPLVTAVLVTLNDEDFVGDCLASLTEQSLSSIEVILVDRGSSDETVRMARQLADSRLTIVELAGTDVDSALRAGVKRARGRYLAFVNGSDRLPKRAYELMTDYLEKSSMLQVIGDWVILASDQLILRSARTDCYTEDVESASFDTHPEYQYERLAGNRMWDAEEFRRYCGKTNLDALLSRPFGIISNPVYIRRTLPSGAQPVGAPTCSATGLIWDPWVLPATHDEILAEPIAPARRARIAAARILVATLRGDLKPMVWTIRQIGKTVRARLTPVCTQLSTHLRKKRAHSVGNPAEVALVADMAVANTTVSGATSCDYPSVAVIVPVYNAEKYLDAALASIAAQSYPNWNALVVIDGSPDGSEHIARRWAERDPRVKVMVTENRGLGATRNFGIENTESDFIMHIDADDLLRPSAIELLVEAAKRDNAEIACGAANDLFEDGSQARYWTQRGAIFQTGTHATNTSTVPELLDDHTSWAKILRRDFLERHTLRYSEGVEPEDIAFSATAFTTAQAITVIPDVVYEHRRHSSAMSASWSRPKAFQDWVSESQKAITTVCANSPQAVQDHYLGRFVRTQLRHRMSCAAQLQTLADVQLLEAHCRFILDHLSESAMANLNSADKLALDTFTSGQASTNWAAPTSPADLDTSKASAETPPSRPNVTHRPRLFAALHENQNPLSITFNTEVMADGIEVVSASDYTAVIRELRDHAKSGPVHIHWLNPLTESTKSEEQAWRNVRVFTDSLRWAKSRGRPIVWTVHDVLPHDTKYPEPAITVHRQLAEIADVIHIMNSAMPVTCSEHYSLPVDKIHHIPHSNYLGLYGTAIDRKKANKQLHLKHRTRKLLFFSQMRPCQGVDILIDSLSHIPKRQTNKFELLIAGPVAPALESGLTELSNSSRNSLHISQSARYVPNQEEPTWLSASDIMVLPYREALDSAAVSLAAIYGVPVILPRSSSLHTDLQGEPWVRFFSDESGSLAELLTGRWYLNPSVRQSAKAWARTNSPRAMSRAYADLIAELVQQSQ